MYIRGKQSFETLFHLPPGLQMHILSSHFGAHANYKKNKMDMKRTKNTKQNIKTDITCIEFKEKIIFRLIDYLKFKGPTVERVQFIDNHCSWAVFMPSQGRKKHVPIGTQDLSHIVRAL